MKDSVFGLQIRFFYEAAGKIRIGIALGLSGALILCAGCRPETPDTEQRLQAPVVAASGEVSPLPPSAAGPPEIPAAKSLEPRSPEVVNVDLSVTEQQPGVAQIPPERYLYPRGRRIPVLEGMDKENFFRFVQVSEDSTRQVLRFYRKRFPLAPYQYGEGARVQHLFSHGSGREGVRVRVASLEAELDGIGAMPGDRTVISLRVEPLSSPDPTPQTEADSRDSSSTEPPNDPGPQKVGGSGESSTPR